MNEIVTFRQYIKTNGCIDTQTMLNLFEKIDQMMANAPIVLKNDATSTVVVIEVDGQKWVVKRSNTRSWLHALRRAFQTSRAKRNWINALMLKQAKIAAITPVAMMEERWGWLKGRSYFVCDFIEGTDALHYFACGAKPHPNWQLVCDNVCRMIQQLAQHRLSHRDLNLSNIIIKDEQPILIDLDAMRKYSTPWMARYAARKEKIRFMENWQEAPGADPAAERLFAKCISCMK